MKVNNGPVQFDRHSPEASKPSDSLGSANASDPNSKSLGTQSISYVPVLYSVSGKGLCLVIFAVLMELIVKNSEI